jgi:cytidylate kinase
MSNLPTTIAVSRQRGSGGSYVGRLVAERMGLLYIDREMLRHAAEYLHSHPANEQVEVSAPEWWSRLGEAFGLGGPDCGYLPPSPAVVYEGDLFEIEKRLIQEIVTTHAATIVGRGAAQTLRGRPSVISVFLHAPEPWRVERVQHVYSITDRRGAQQMVRDSDKDRAKFIRALAGVDWTDIRAYDLALNTASLGFEAAVDLIMRAVGARTAAGSQV